MAREGLTARLWCAAAAAAVVVACIRTETPGPEPVQAPEAAAPAPLGAAGVTAPVPGGPEVAIGIVVGAAQVAIGGGGSVRIAARGGDADILPADTVWDARTAGGGVAVAGPGGSALRGQELTLAPAETGYVRINGRDYRGRVTLTATGGGVTAVNRLSLEEYLAGVVGGELGRRDPREVEALRAQAIVSRTYALRNRGRWRALGFDFRATVADQVYLGVGSENQLASAAVNDTRGRILAWNGQAIDAFFFSTCGGRTADGTEVFRGADRPYLRSVFDLRPDGSAWCDISPRFRWHEEWNADQLVAALRRSLPETAGVPPSRVGSVRDVRVTGRTASGRVGELTIALADGDVRVSGAAVRQTLRTPAGEILRSAAFTLEESSADGRVTRLVADGSGAGHGVGFCQWGSIGRARAGQSAAEILAAYFPGTSLTQAY